MCFLSYLLALLQPQQQDALFSNFASFITATTRCLIFELATRKQYFGFLMAILDN